MQQNTSRGDYDRVLEEGDGDVGGRRRGPGRDDGVPQEAEDRERWDLEVRPPASSNEQQKVSDQRRTQ